MFMQGHENWGLGGSWTRAVPWWTREAKIWGAFSHAHTVTPALQHTHLLLLPLLLLLLGPMARPQVKHKPGAFLVYWTVQAIWVWVTMSPVLIINTAASATPLRWFDFLGGLWHFWQARTFMGLSKDTGHAGCCGDAWRSLCQCPLLRSGARMPARTNHEGTSPSSCPKPCQAGAALWGVGLSVEAVADWQKDRWRARPENRGKFINEGLWSVSRYVGIGV